MISKKIRAYILGVLLVAMGIASLIKASLGLASIDASCFALSQITGLTVGEAVIIVNISLIVLGSIIKFSSKRLLSIGVTLVFGKLVDLFIWLFSLITGGAVLGTVITAIAFFGGTILIPLGAVMMIHSDLPMLSGEVLWASLQERFKISDGLSKFIVESLFFIFAVVVCLIADYTIEEFHFFDIINHYTVFLYLSASYLFPIFSSKLKGDYLYVQQIN